jgi:hypothetical protein
VYGNRTSDHAILGTHNDASSPKPCGGHIVVRISDGMGVRTYAITGRMHPEDRKPMSVASKQAVLMAAAWQYMYIVDKQAARDAWNSHG